MSQNRQKLIKILASTGPLSTFVSNKISKPGNQSTNEGFKEKFSKLPQGPEREKLVYEAALKQGPPKNLVPVTITGENGIKLTYYTMPDYLTIDGIRVSLDGQDSQRLADAWNMILPTRKMSKQIYDAADTKIFATPLSSSGTTINGKYYSPKEVVKTKIGDTGAILNYDNLTNHELSQYLKANPSKKPNLIAGHRKDIVQPEYSNKLGLYGWYDQNGKPIQDTISTPHGISGHVEYATGLRLIGNNITITKPDGTKINTTTDKLFTDPNLSKLVSDGGNKIKRYNL